MDASVSFWLLCVVLMTCQSSGSTEVDLTNFDIRYHLTIKEEFTYDKVFATDVAHCATYCVANTSCLSATYDDVNVTCQLSVYRFNTTDSRLLSRSTSVVLTREGCSDGWVKLGDKCYLFRDDQVSKWEAAQEFCGQYGAMIAEPQTITTYQLIKDYMKNVLGENRFWLGVIIKEDGGNFTYVWSRTGSTTAYTDWNDTAMEMILAHKSKRCVEFDVDYKWDPTGCKTNSNALCEK